MIHGFGFHVSCFGFRVSRRKMCAWRFKHQGDGGNSARTTIGIMFREKVAPVTIRRWTPTSSAIFGGWGNTGRILYVKKKRCT